MREWKFRAWDPETKKMYSPEDLEEPDASEDTPKTIFGKIVDGKLVILDTKHATPLELIPTQSTNWYDMEQYEIFEGDILVDKDGKQQVAVVWDAQTGCYLLKEKDGTLIPGGAYLTDIIKIVGNVFQNEDDYGFKQREFKYRAWNPDAKKMYLPDDLKDPEKDMDFSVYGYLSFGALYIYDFILDPPMEMIPMQSTGWKDKFDKQVYEGDIVELDGELAQLCWSDETGGFMFMSNDGSLYPGDAQTAQQVEVIGNIYENEGAVPQFKW
jgi:hypothetical protein